MDVLAPLVAIGQSPKVIEPGHRPLHHPAMSTELVAGIYPFARDANPDVAVGQRRSAPGTRSLFAELCGLNLETP